VLVWLPCVVHVLRLLQSPPSHPRLPQLVTPEQYALIIDGFVRGLPGVDLPPQSTTTPLDELYANYLVERGLTAEAAEALGRNDVPLAEQLMEQHFARLEEGTHDGGASVGAAAGNPTGASAASRSGASRGFMQPPTAAPPAGLPPAAGTNKGQRSSDNTAPRDAVEGVALGVTVHINGKVRCVGGVLGVCACFAGFRTPGRADTALLLFLQPHAVRIHHGETAAAAANRLCSANALMVADCAAIASLLRSKFLEAGVAEPVPQLSFTQPPANATFQFGDTIPVRD